MQQIVISLHIVLRVLAIVCDWAWLCFYNARLHLLNDLRRGLNFRSIEKCLYREIIFPSFLKLLILFQLNP